MKAYVWNTRNRSKNGSINCFRNFALSRDTLVTLNRFLTLFYFIFCWLWTSKCWLGNILHRVWFCWKTFSGLLKLHAELVREAIVCRCSTKKLFLKNSQKSQGNNCAGESPVLRWIDPAACNFIKKCLKHKCFPMNFVKFLEHLFYRTPPADFFCGWKRKLNPKKFLYIRINYC